MAKNTTRRKFIGSTIASVGLLGVTAAANVAANKFSSLLDHYVGGRPATVEKVAGSEDWDAEYYTANYRGRNQATEAANELVTIIEGEGIVLMKNDNDALPLSTSNTVSMLGRTAADPIYGGSGSGTVDASSCINFHQGISQAGFTINDTAYNWINDNYSNYDKANITMDNQSTATYYIGEIPWSDYSSDAQASINGTVGLVFIGRGGGEGGDLSRDLKGDVDSGVSENFKANSETANYVDGQHELELTVEEKSVIAAAKAACTKVIAILNLSTSMELGPLMSGEYEVDAILEVGSIGATGAAAVGQVLAGTVNPSGRTTDIWAADFTADPTFKNFGGKRYTDVENYYPEKSTGNAYFVEYAEGLYYGYRYYETAAIEAEAGNYSSFDYGSAVVFPFGYGLSYTTFSQVLDSVSTDNDQVKVQVTVSNTGSVAGKDVVEVYYSAPYTKGGLEKPAVVLGGFAKTDLFDPGASVSVAVEFPVRDMASYSSDDQAYVLDAGDYVISLRTDSHTVVDEKTVTLDAKKYTTDSATEAAISNKFDDMTQYMEKNVKTMSRSDFKGTFPEEATDKSAADCGVELVEWKLEDYEDPSAQMPTTGADNGLQLIDMRGEDYDSEAWDDILDQLSVEDMATCLNDDAYNTPQIESVGKPATVDPDGPAGFTSLTGPTGNCSYCSEVVMAQTWNVGLMRQMGQMIGQEALASSCNGWYAPAMNMHRSPFAGRNFEYYSEDPLLAGKIGAAVVSGAAENGCYAYIKHFAMNDQESYRVQHVCTWATEQVAREIYLRPFETTIKEATYEMKYISDDKGTVSTKTMPGCTGVMSSFNYVGAEWAGGRKSLCTEVLRDEWGFKGMVITDFELYDYMDKNQAIYAGTDLQLTYSAMTGEYEGTNTATVVNQMRESMHRVLYTVANSNAMNGMVPGSKITYGVAPWQYGVWGGSAALVALAAFFGYKAVKNHKLMGAEETDGDAVDVPEVKKGDKKASDEK
ncbi:glycoside hydrolase family 3 C-terminal domain-containing protein [Olsenella sp. Marseille-P4559]|uniref:glycoside hydrolase family 3 C-terminal domain-containing protein n=1 Tax=Olsenella sp. Marseille-P4559 TaxID=2364795 RepID=UPI0013EF2915|nr:glycoside hydrolase family 3 N-terminal domain-containing protein [Olsenella sp. Marseille-P4559]